MEILIVGEQMGPELGARFNGDSNGWRIHGMGPELGARFNGDSELGPTL